MAKRKPVKRSSSRGGTLYGVLTGLLLGLIVAAAVAFYVTRAPIPFVDRASRHADHNPLPEPGNAPDPNIGLYGRDGAAGTAPSGPTATPPAPMPGTPRGPAPPQGPDDLGALIATLPATPESPSDSPKAAGKTSDKTAGKPADKTAAPAAAGQRDDAKEATGKYFLQAGAYRGAAEAEALRARILLMGLPVAVQRAQVNGKSINRVRVGPFARLDDMNRARTRLGENKIEVAVIRQ